MLFLDVDAAGFGDYPCLDGGGVQRHPPYAVRPAAPSNLLDRNGSPMHRCSPRRLLLIVVLLLCSAAACRRHDPPQRLAKNLGTPDHPVLPTVVKKYDPDIMSGKAAPIRAAEVDEDDADTDGLDDDADTNGADAEDAVSDEDRELIDELFDAAIVALAEERVGDLSKLIVPDQQETLSGLFEQVDLLSKAGDRLTQIIQEKAPQMAAAMAGMMTVPGLPPGALADQRGKLTHEQLAQLFEIGDLRMTADDRALATIEAMGKKIPVELWVVDDEWYIHLPEPLENEELVGELVRVGKLLTEKIEDLATRLEDGSVAPEALMPEFMKMGQELMPVFMELGPKLQQLVVDMDPPTGSEGDDAEDADLEEAEGAEEADDADDDT